MISKIFKNLDNTDRIITAITLSIIAIMGIVMFGRYYYFAKILPNKDYVEFDNCVDTANTARNVAEISRQRTECFDTYPQHRNNQPDPLQRALFLLERE